jgi:hypothetical protein
MTGLQLSHYLIEDELGRGSVGIVFKAQDTKQNRTVAGRLVVQVDREQTGEAVARGWIIDVVVNWINEFPGQR